MPSIQDIQNVGYQIMDEVASFCENNNLKYLMIGGTFLGAVRHKGFIPWDDDIDIAMPLADFRKFVHLYSNDDYFVDTPCNEIKTPYIMNKVRKNGTRMSEEIFDNLPLNHGIWLDVFIYVNAGRNKITKKLQVFFHSVLHTYRCRYYHSAINNKKWIHRFFTKLPKKIQVGIDDMLIDMIRLCGSKKSTEYYVIDVCKPHKRFVNKKYYDNTTVYQFGKKEYQGPKDYDAFLSFFYGKDYMIPQKWSHIKDYSDVIL